jgi:hypothetical protein
MHTWKFFRTGGLDQVAIESGADLLNLEHLDQKLWVALSCPVKGLELDEATLRMLDADGDGRIRVPELLAAIKWAGPRLKDLGVLLAGQDGLPLAAINDATPEGKIVLTSAKHILENLGRREATVITVAESSNTAQIFATNPLNGDGVIPPSASEDPAAQQLIKDIIACLGPTKDRTGADGVTVEQVDQFFADLNNYIHWTAQSAVKEIAVLGDGTAAAVAAVQAVRPKVDDYFARCRLAAFDSRATAALNRAETEYLAIAAKDLTISSEEVAAFPLARIEADQALPLTERLNPAWANAIGVLRHAAIVPLLGERSVLTEAEWTDLKARLNPYETWLGTKAGAAVEKLGLERIKEILNGHGYDDITTLVASDRALEPEYKAITDVDRLTHFHRDFRALLHNFVNFADFYSANQLAIFQAGVLYFDARSMELCVAVDGPTPLAAMSKICLAYCACTRTGSPAMNLAVCVTQGDSDYLFVGRRGIFYDRQGRDWDAVVTSIVDNPISIRQAFWSPYKKFVRFIGEQAAKRAAAADTAATGKLATAAETGANLGQATPPPAPPPAPAPAKKFDLALITGIGVAIGSIGTFLAMIFTKFFELGPWIPLGLVGIILVISLPSMAIAWLKLRQRTLGPLLEGNGWAINGRVKINIPFGAKLTEVAKLPPGSRRSLVDPYEDHEAATRRRQLILGLLVLVLAALFIRIDHTRRGHYFWQNPPPAPAPAAPVTPAAPAAAPVTPEK